MLIKLRFCFCVTGSYSYTHSQMPVPSPRQNFFPLKQSQQTQRFIELWKQETLEVVMGQGKELGGEEGGGLLRCFG